MSVDLSFVSIGCNRLANCASWSSSGLIAYGAGSFVALYNMNDQHVWTLRGHKDRVNCVEWINENELVSGSTDCTLIVWKKDENGSFKEISKLKSHDKSVTSISVLEYPGNTGKVIIASTSSDKTVSLWLRQGNNEEWKLQQHSKLVGEAVECCALHVLPKTKNNEFVPILALGGVGGAGSCRGSEIILHILKEENNNENNNILSSSRIVTLKGHEDWIRCLSFITCDDGSILLASSAQDNFIRLWKLDTSSEEELENEKKKANDIFASLALLDTINSTSMSQQGHTFKWNNDVFSIILESVLYGHEDWVYSVNWHPKIKNEKNGNLSQPLCLLSASMDKTMMIWRPQEEENGIWVNEVRVGELGGNTLGFYGGLFSPNGDYILAHGYNGAFHLWSKPKNDDERWDPCPTVSGHFAPINDCCWEPSGDYFLTISQDQTARIFSTWLKDNNKNIYCEVSRPQIHGYDLECGCFINEKSHCFVTGAEEKIYRVFDAPKSFIHNLQSISGKTLTDKNEEQRPLGANVPSLGLSNKPVFTIEEKSKEEIEKEKESLNDGSDLYEPPKPADPVFLSRPPFEEELLQSTLWPEIQKLYGHGNYTFCVSSSKCGDLLATAVRAKSDPEQATIRLWETNTWKEVANLHAHKLTVTELRFSNNDKYLLSSGRDRQFSLFKRIEGQSNFKLVNKQLKAHDRIIWSCDWSCDDLFFVTGSRDKVCKIWKLNEDDDSFTLYGKFTPSKSGITSVSFAPRKVKIQKDKDDFSYLLAVGLENGIIQLWSFNEDKPEFTCSLSVPIENCHADAVKRIRWQPIKDEESNMRFISCSVDQSVRLFDVTL